MVSSVTGAFLSLSIDWPYFTFRPSLSDADGLMLKTKEKFSLLSPHTRNWFLWRLSTSKVLHHPPPSPSASSSSSSRLSTYPKETLKKHPWHTVMVLKDGWHRCLMNIDKPFSDITSLRSSLALESNQQDKIFLSVITLFLNRGSGIFLQLLHIHYVAAGCIVPWVFMMHKKIIKMRGTSCL